MVGNDTSSEIWDTLARLFSFQSQAKIMQYKLQLQSFKKGAMNMKEYLTKIKAHYDTLATVTKF